MPEKETIERARRDKREGKAPSTQAGEFVREEIEHVREGKHGARSTKQAIASDCRRLDAPVWNCRRQRALQRKHVSRPNAICAGPAKNVSAPLAGYFESAQERRPQCCLEESTFTASSYRREQTIGCITFPFSKESGCDTKEVLSLGPQRLACSSR